eukprot:m.309767 g.309767  ORF g.309767 m.309767 type:complete len:347 (-) comp20202_c0_seq6:339-1379(-)
MAPVKPNTPKQHGIVGSIVDLIRWLLVDPNATGTTSILLLIAEAVLCCVVINLVPYTEIDWKAYMDEVEGVVNGTYDYPQLKGDTGPLVYPAGFVYVFLGFYYATNHGVEILAAQYMFAVVYVAFIAVVHEIYKKAKCPPYVLIIMSCISYRIHSIFILRLFNDPIAMLLLYGAVILFLRNRWAPGCVLFSLAVSVKMNILLFAPGLLFLLLAALGIWETAQCLSICAGIQVILGLPFLTTNFLGYMERAFNLGRQFQYIWTVNWKFVSEETFLDRRAHVALLAGHLVILTAFALHRWPRYWRTRLTHKVSARPPLLCADHNICVVTIISESKCTTQSCLVHLVGV